MSGTPLTTPPDGVVAGEDVPPENDAEDFDQAKVERVMAVLKSRGEPYSTMKDSELRDKARRLIE